MLCPLGGATGRSARRSMQCSASAALRVASVQLYGLDQLQLWQWHDEAAASVAERAVLCEDRLDVTPC